MKRDRAISMTGHTQGNIERKSDIPQTCPFGHAAVVMSARGTGARHAGQSSSRPKVLEVTSKSAGTATCTCRERFCASAATSSGVPGRRAFTTMRMTKGTSLAVKRYRFSIVR